MLPRIRTWNMRRKPSATLRANAGATRGRQWQVPRAGPQSKSHEISQAIRYLPSLLLPQLAWRRVGMERVMGIEPTLAAWEAAVLPLNYTRVPRIVREVRRARQSGLLPYASIPAKLRGVIGFVRDVAAMPSPGIPRLHENASESGHGSGIARRGVRPVRVHCRRGTRSRPLRRRSLTLHRGLMLAQGHFETPAAPPAMRRC